MKKKLIPRIAITFVSIFVLFGVSLFLSSDASSKCKMTITVDRGDKYTIKCTLNLRYKCIASLSNATINGKPAVIEMECKGKHKLEEDVSGNRNDDIVIIQP